MAVSSSIGKDNHYLTVIGAAFFVISDSLIALNRFVFKIQYSGLLIMVTYYVAQFLIIIGIIKNIKRTLTD